MIFKNISSTQCFSFDKMRGGDKNLELLWSTLRRMLLIFEVTTFSDISALAFLQMWWITAQHYNLDIIQYITAGLLI